MPSRILTFTPNPNLDLTLTVPDVRLDEVLRATESRVDPGGKGFNVARALGALGTPCTALAFLGGETGARLKAMMEAAGVRVYSAPIAEETRTCYVVTDATGTHHLKVNEAGPVISPSELSACLDLVQASMLPGDIWVLAGSLSPGLPANFYAQLVRRLRTGGARPVLDASGEAMGLGLREQPFLIKPNALEASELLGVEIRTASDAARAAAQLSAMGIEIAAISLGADGLVLSQGKACVHAQPPVVQACNTVGAGDATVAGMLWALSQGLPLAEMARWGAACGTAAAMRPGTDFGTHNEVYALALQVRVESLAG